MQVLGTTIVHEFHIFNSHNVNWIKCAFSLCANKWKTLEKEFYQTKALMKLFSLQISFFRQLFKTKRFSLILALILKVRNLLDDLYKQNDTSFCSDPTRTDVSLFKLFGVSLYVWKSCRCYYLQCALLTDLFFSLELWQYQFFILFWQYFPSVWDHKIWIIILILILRRRYHRAAATRSWPSLLTEVARESMLWPKRDKAVLLHRGKTN